MRKTLLLFILIPFTIQAQYGAITAGTQAQLTIPNLSTQQILAIPNPKHGSMVYDLTENCTKIYNGTAWKCTSSALNDSPVNQPANQSNALLLEPGTAGTMGLPQLSDAQIKAIVSPKTGSIVYDKTLGCVRYYDGEIWRCTTQGKMNYPEALTGWKPSSDDRFTGRVAVDPSGNIIMAGHFVNSITLGATTFSANGIQQIFCVKYNRTGGVIWAKKIEATNYSSIEAISIGTDGSIYLAGMFTLTLDLGGVFIQGGSRLNIFLAKLDNNGNAIWGKNINSDSDGGVTFRSLQLDKQNNPIITGYFGAGNLYLADSGTPLTSGPSFTGFVAKYNYSGSFAWCKALAGSWQSTCMSTTADSDGNIYLAGYFSGSISFPGGSTINSVNGSDIFIVKYQSDGTFVWVKHEGSMASEYANYICFANGKLLVVGVTDNGTTIGSFNLPSQLSNTLETFYASLNVADQTWNWAFKADGYTYATNAVMHNDNEFYMLGLFTNHQITNFGNKSVWGDAGGTYLVKGNMSNGNILYFRKMFSESSMQDILPLDGSKKLISALSQYPVTIGDTFLTSPGLNFQAFIGIITE